MRTRLSYWLLLMALVAGCGEGVVVPDGGPAAAEDAGGGGVFIALGGDFAGFESWEAFKLGHQDADGNHSAVSGEKTVYLNRRPPAGATAFPVGTIIIKAIVPDPGDQTTWELLAMAKRGGGYNPRGAEEWEWIELGLSRGEPYIKWRGTGPPAGEEYGQMGGTCNLCHTTGDAVANDYVLTPALSLARIAR